MTIYDPDPLRRLKPAAARQAAADELVIPIPALLNVFEEKLEYYKAIGIYRAASSRPERGEPVAWIELLSPSNKPPHADFVQYHEKRTEVLQSGIVFVEMDYLHQFPPTFDSVPNYRPLDKTQPPEPESHPYRISVMEPRPDFYEGQGHVRQFDVDDPIPAMAIPLSAEDVLKFDFGAPYRKTFEEMIYGNKVDYSQLPVNFELYSEADQARIVSRMVAVLMAARNGQDLEQAVPLIVQPISLEEGLEQLETFATIP